MNFRVGEKVVRVGSKQGRWAKYEGKSTYSAPALGEVCTVRTVNDWPTITLITLVEHNNSHITVNGWEPGFDAKCFRKVVERKTDISIFTKMLDETRVKAPA